MHRAMCNPRDINFKLFASHLTEVYKYLPLLPGSSTAKKIPPEDLNEILLHSVPIRWANQAYAPCWYFETKSYRATCKIFNRMEVAEKIYKVVNTSKN